MTDHVVDHGVDEAVELRFGHRLHAHGSHAHGEAGDGGFIQWRIQDAVGTETLLQAGRGAEHAAIHANVFAQHHHRIVMRNFPGQCLGDGFDQGDGQCRLLGLGFSCSHGLCDFNVHGRGSLLACSAAMAAARCASSSGGGSAYR